MTFAQAQDALIPCEAKAAVFALSPGVQANGQSLIRSLTVLTGKPVLSNMNLEGFVTDAQGRFKISFTQTPLAEAGSYYLRLEVHQSRYLASGVAGLGHSIKEAQITRASGSQAATISGQVLCHSGAPSTRAGIWFDGMAAPSLPLAAKSSAASTVTPTPAPPPVRLPTEASPPQTSRLMPSPPVESGLTADQALGVKAQAMNMLAMMCMSGYPETRPAILKRFRQDIESASNKQWASRVLDADFELSLKELLSRNEPATIFFSDPDYWKCSHFSPAIIEESEMKVLQEKLGDQLHYATEVLAQCTKRYPGQNVAALQDRQKALNEYFGPRRGAAEFNDAYGYSVFLKNHYADRPKAQADVNERIQQLGESGWQARCKPS